MDVLKQLIVLATLAVAVLGILSLADLGILIASAYFVNKWFVG